jgi:response regulator of citrate/malate metabolism
MAGKTITMSKLKQIIRLRDDGVALQTIAEAVDISRNTVKKILATVKCTIKARSLAFSGQE